MNRRAIGVACVVGLIGQAALGAQTVPTVNLPASPRGNTAIQVAGEWVDAANGPQYHGGMWVVVDYGRPILRGRPDIFGSGADYGRTVMDGAPVWRAGANATTQLTTQVPLQFGTAGVPPGIYNVLVDLKPGAWTLILSTQPVQRQFNPDDQVNLYGSINYDPTFEVLRTAMSVAAAPVRVEQFTIEFVDVTSTGGTLLMAWDRTVARASFSVK